VRWVARTLRPDGKPPADSYLALKDTFAVADGMGRSRASVLASKKAVELLARERPITSEEQMRAVFLKINGKLVREMGAFGDEEVSGTTLSALSVFNGSFVFGHAGDSRIYLFRDGKLTLLTEDQVKYRGNKKLVSVLGLQWSPPVQTGSGEVRPGDLFLLTSDGINQLGDEEFLMSLIRPGYPHESAKNLEKAFMRLGAEDELTFVLIQL